MEDYTIPVILVVGLFIWFIYYHDIENSSEHKGLSFSRFKKLWATGEYDIYVSSWTPRGDTEYRIIEDNPLTSSYIGYCYGKDDFILRRKG